MKTKIKTALPLTSLLFCAAAFGGLHPDVTLLDSNGLPVSDSGLPMSSFETCGDCHNTEFIVKNHDHPKHIASNCLLCHSDVYDGETFFETKQSNHPDWAVTSGLLKNGFVEFQDAQWQWSAETVQAGSEFTAEALGIKASDSDVCAQCHGIVHNSPDPLALSPENPLGRLTQKEGAIYSGQRLSDTAMSFVGDVDQDRTFDIHAERLLECTDCHRAANNPVHGGAKGSNLSHLAHDPRQVDLSEFLERPDHNLIIGVAGGDGNCQGCHEPADSHAQWLPEVAAHFDALTCQACHITELYGPAAQFTDYSVRDMNGEPLVIKRGLSSSGTSYTGFTPLLLQRPQDLKFAPFNVRLVRYWRDAKTNESVAADTVTSAWQLSGLPAASAQTTLTDSDINNLQTALRSLGVAEPELANIVNTLPINHGVSRDRWANGDCESCHSENGLLQSAMTLGTANSGFVAPSNSVDSPALIFVTSDDGALSVRGETLGHYELKNNLRFVYAGSGLAGALALLGFWQWFRKNRR
jgi:hypothetical protein